MDGKQSIFEHLTRATSDAATSGTSGLVHFADGVFPVPSCVDGEDQPTIVIGLDNGNDALKLSVLTPGGGAVGLRIPTAYMPAREIQGGKGELTYQVNTGLAFWMGDVALRHDGGALPIGPTDQRLVDQRQHDVIGAALAELLFTAGYAPGSYSIAMCIAVPNKEIVLHANNRLGVVDTTAKVLRERVKGYTWHVRRIASTNAVSDWELQVKELMPQAQSVGTLMCWSRSPLGQLTTDLDGLVIVDIGGGDLQSTEITLAPYQYGSRRLGDGTITLARALATRFPGEELNDVAAQHALVTRKMLVSGRFRAIDHEVNQVLATTGQDLVGRILPVLRQTRRYVILTGGGVVLLQKMLAERLLAAGKSAETEYTMMPVHLASYTNSFGALFAMVFRLTKRTSVA